MVLVTVRDMYAQVQTLTGEVRDVASQLRDRLAPAYVDHETRLRALERWRYALPLSLVAGAASAVTTILFAVWR